MKKWINKKKLTWFWNLLRDSYKELNHNDPLRLSSSTAFFATFSLIPILILLLTALGTIFSQQILTGEIFEIMQQVLGEDATQMLSNILYNVQDMQQGPLITIALFVFLMFVATTLFIVIQSSFNQVWQVKPKEDVDFRFMLKSRGISLVIILFSGLLFLVALLSDIILTFIDDQLLFLLSEVNIVMVTILNLAFNLAIFTIWLAAIYKYLPDINLSWRPVWFGSFLGGILFLLGQFILGQVLVAGNLNNIYGASASIVLLLLFIFYSSFILYYGICLVKNYAEKKGYETKPTKFAVRYKVEEVE